jgi:hypothetical protein
MGQKNSKPHDSPGIEVKSEVGVSPKVVVKVEEIYENAWQVHARKEARARAPDIAYAASKLSLESSQHCQLSQLSRQSFTFADDPTVYPFDPHRPLDELFPLCNHEQHIMPSFVAETAVLRPLSPSQKDLIHEGDWKEFNLRNVIVLDKFGKLANLLSAGDTNLLILRGELPKLPKTLAAYCECICDR